MKLSKCLMSIVASTLSIVLSFLIGMTFAAYLNWPTADIVVVIAVMGGFILYEIKKD